MTERIGAAASLAVCAALLCMANPVLAHEGHRKAGSEAAAEAPPGAASDPAPPDAALEPGDHTAAPPASPSEPAPEHPTIDGVSLVGWLGRFHPPLTHFPIALLIAAATAELLFLRSGSELFEQSVRFTVWFGALAAVPAAALGWLFGGFRLVDDEWVMTAHRWAGTGTAVLSLWILFLFERVGRGTVSRAAFRGALLAGVAFVAATGFLGGALIYGLDHYSPWVSK